MTEESINLRISGGSTAPRRARTALAALNGSLGSLREPVELLVSELVTNCVKHAGVSPEAVLELKVNASNHCVRVEVNDGGRGFLVPDPLPEPGLRGKFGLFLVDRVAHRWGVIQKDSLVWFEIDRTEDRPAI